MKAMILAAGYGKRMLPLTNSIPKPLVKLNDRFLIEYAIEALKSAGIYDIVINIHHLKKQIKANLKDGKQLGVNIKYSEESQLLDTGGGVMQAINEHLIGEEPFIIMSSDIITNYDINRLLSKPSKGSVAHLILVPNPDFKPEGDFSLNNDYITMPIRHHLNLQTSEQIKPTNMHPTQQLQHNTKNFTYANIGIFTPKFFENIDSTETIFPLSKLINKHINNQQITGEVYDGLWQNIGTLKDLHRMNHEIEPNA